MATRTVTTESKNADGFVNVSVIDKAGNKHSFSKGFALYASRPLDKLILANPDSLLQALKEGRVQFSVYNAEKTQETVIDL